MRCASLMRCASEFEILKEEGGDVADNNWIKINRKIRDNFVWDFDKPEYGLAWIDILLMANYKDNKMLVNGSPVFIERGSFITSMVKLSKRWNMNRRTVKRFLDLLVSEQMITYETSKMCTTVKVSNYKAYQGFFDNECTTECTTDCTTDCTQRKKEKNINNIKEREKEKINYQEIVDLYNDTCVSLPALVKLTDSRKRQIKARLKNNSFDDFKKVFEKAEASDFLKGLKNSDGRDWKANFDWLMKENNMIKVLEGNYDNDPNKANNHNSNKAKTTNKFNDFSQRHYSDEQLDELEKRLLRK